MDSARGSCGMSGSFLLSVRVACMLVLSACMLVLLCMCKYIYSFRLVLFEPQATQWTRTSSTLRGGWCLCIDGLLLRRLAWLPLKNCVCRIVCVELCVANCAWRIVRVELCVANCACRIVRGELCVSNCAWRIVRVEFALDSCMRIHL